jgi:hypothetical protein
MKTGWTSFLKMGGGILAALVIAGGGLTSCSPSETQVTLLGRLCLSAVPGRL